MSKNENKKSKKVKAKAEIDTSETGAPVKKSKKKGKKITKKGVKAAKLKVKKAKRDNSNRPRGEAHPRAKLGDKDIEAIRKAYAIHLENKASGKNKKGGANQSELARHYGVSVTYLHKIVHNQAR